MFDGFGPEARGFLRELAANNRKEWFSANKDRYERHIREVGERFIDEMGPHLTSVYPEIRYDTRRNGAGSMMRIHRDIRFSPDKRPYKENVGIVFWIGDGKKVELPGFYFHLGIQESFFYGGQHIFPKPLLQAYRSAVDEEESGSRLTSILKELQERGLPIMEEPAYKRVPRGFDSEHPRSDLLRYGGIGVARRLSAEELESSRLVPSLIDTAEAMKPLLDWLLPLPERVE
jgi:uncharacterized protein (TIGR02453 family)